MSEWDDLAILSLHVARRIPLSFCLEQQWVGICFVLISEWNDFIYSETPRCMMHPNKFLLKRIYGLEEVV